MATEKRFGDKQLDILHDHYKETFAHVRERERSRDRLFLWVILLFALLALEIGYPAEFSGSMGSISILGGELDLGALPLAALLSATWVLTFAVVLRYCQTSVWVSRQYAYVHALEDVISPALGGGNIYRREGKVYLDNYPVLLDVAWVAYVVIFPLIIVLATVGLVLWEATQLSFPWFHRLFDGLIAITLVTVLILYRVAPYVSTKWRAWRPR